MNLQICRLKIRNEETILTANPAITQHKPAINITLLLTISKLIYSALAPDVIRKEMQNKKHTN